jgi:hypothetical protein
MCDCCIGAGSGGKTPYELVKHNQATKKLLTMAEKEL